MFIAMVHLLPVASYKDKVVTPRGRREECSIECYQKHGTELVSGAPAGTAITFQYEFFVLFILFNGNSWPLLAGGDW
jgi:hypothetical protein